MAGRESKQIPASKSGAKENWEVLSYQKYLGEVNATQVSREGNISVWVGVWHLWGSILFWDSPGRRIVNPQNIYSVA